MGALAQETLAVYVVSNVVSDGERRCSGGRGGVQYVYTASVGDDAEVVFGIAIWAQEQGPDAAAARTEVVHFQIGNQTLQRLQEEPLRERPAVFIDAK